MLTAVFDISWIFWLFVVAQFFVPLLPEANARASSE